jgi:hypothetical protein
MNRPTERRSGYASGVSPLSSGPAPSFDAPGAGVQADQRGCYPVGKGRVGYMHSRPDQYMTASGPVPGAPPVQGSPVGEPLAPAIGPGEAGFGGPGSEPSTLQRFADSWGDHLKKLMGR